MGFFLTSCCKSKVSFYLCTQIQKNLIIMKKLLASLIVFGFAIAMVACGAKKEEAAATMDTVTTIIEAPVEMDTTAVDSLDSIK
jgi:hypothetical protein